MQNLWGVFCMKNGRIKVRNISNIKDLICQSENLFKSKPAFMVKKNADEYSPINYSQLKNDMDCLGTAFLELGLKDKYIAVLGENRYEWCLTYLSTVNGVGTIVPLDKELPIEELENLLNRSNSSAIVFSGKYRESISQLISKLPNLKYFINMDLDGDTKATLSFSKLLNKGRELISSGDHTYLDAEVDEEKMSTLLFTSGTTDLAKGVMLSHKNICSNIMSVCSVIYLDHNDSVLSILPLHHAYECTCGFLLMLYNGCTISFNEGLKHIGKNMKEVKPSILICVPLIIEGMYKKIWDQASKKRGLKTKLKIALKLSNFLLKVFNLDFRKKLFKSIHDSIGGNMRLIISGAAAINPEVSHGLRSMGITVLQGYGLTECSPIATVNVEENNRDSSIGLSLPGVQVKVDTPNEEGIGEIIIKGKNVMLGYYQNQLATDKVLKSNWLYTGDLGYMDKDGFFYITGRKKNVIVTKNGKNIFPEEVESYLNKSPFIQESLVYGVEDETTSEMYVNAQIVIDLDAIKEKLNINSPSDSQIYELIKSEIKLVNKSMPLYKRISNFSVREHEFIKTTTKKIKRYAEVK